MPTEQEFQGAFDQVKDFIERIGDIIVAEDVGIIEENGNEKQYRTVTAESPSHSCYYNVIGYDDRELFSLRYRFDLMAQISDFVQTEEGKEVLDLDEFDAVNEMDAAKTIINRVSTSDMERLKFQIENQITNPITASQISETEDGGIRSFLVYRHFFPYEENFTLSDFYNTSMAVTNVGEKGGKYLSNSFAIEITSEEKESPETKYSLKFSPEDIF